MTIYAVIKDNKKIKKKTKNPLKHRGILGSICIFVFNWKGRNKIITFKLTFGVLSPSILFIENTTSQVSPVLYVHTCIW